MRYFFNAVLGAERIEDPEGAEFAEFYAALAEAEQVARELAAEELRQGRTVPAGWQIEVMDVFGRVQETVPFDTLFTKPAAKSSGLAPTLETSAPHVTGPAQPAPLKESIVQYHQRTHALLEESKCIGLRIRETFEEIRLQLATLDGLTRM